MRRLMAVGVAALAVALASFFVPVHAGAADCGSVAAPGADSGTTDCKDYQRALLLGGGVAFLAGVAMLGARWHLGRPVLDEEEEPE